MGQWTEEQPKKDKNFCNEYIVFFVDEKTFLLPVLQTESACKFENNMCCVCECW